MKISEHSSYQKRTLSSVTLVEMPLISNILLRGILLDI